jgi:hypothetical protein
VLEQDAFEPGIGIGAGIIHAWASSPLRAFDGANGTGLQVVVESHLTDRLVWDLRLGGFYSKLEAPEEIFYPADDGDWTLGSTALRVDVVRTGDVTWWAGPEGSYHYAQMKHFHYVGSGFGLGPVVGLDIPFSNGRFVARFGTHLSWVWLETDTATPSRTTFVATVAIDMLYRFRRTGPD